MLVSLFLSIILYTSDTPYPPGDIARAEALIKMPAGTPVNHPLTELADVLRYVAIREQLISEEEGYSYFVNNSFRYDLDQMRYKYEALVDCPRMPEITMFPDRSSIIVSIGFNKRFTSYLIQRLPFEQDRELLLAEAIRECKQTAHIYSLLSVVTLPARTSLSLMDKRLYLKELQFYLGDNFEKEIPPPVPMWAMWELVK